MTTREHFERVRTLFVGALERSAEKRRAWLEEECAGDVELVREVEDLLDRSDAADPTSDDESVRVGARATGARNAFSDFARGASLLARPQRIGGYEILHVIGSGGMGTVYAAEQKQPRRRVALKLLHGGLLSEKARRRFEYEAELLGRLRHPGIAHIYEAGVADSGFGPQPFLAMELVDGERVTHWIDRSRPSTKRKLELFVELCLAVQHAHERGVIHRDLKPDNILVERDGRPKVLDFGIARAIETDAAVATRLTEAGAVIGTLAYMSPERLADDPDAIDTRSDVYSLGVILHELLSGTRPYPIDGLPIGKAIETIRFAEPATLSATANVARDLSIIVAKAIDKEPARRYASAAALAEDVQRYLRDETITARPASTLYQVRKLVHRHRALAIGLTAVFVMLLLGLAGTMWQAHTAEMRRQEADRERTIAEDERAKAENNAAETKLVADFQSGLLANLSVDEFGHSLVIDLRQELARRLAESGRTSDEIEKTLASFDDIVRPANSTNVAQRVLEARVFAPAVEKIEKEYGEKQLLAAMLETPLAETLKNLGLYELGVRAARRAVDARQATLGNDDAETLTSIATLGRLYLQQGQLGEAEPLVREALSGRRARLGETHHDTLDSVGDLATLLTAQGKFAEAERLFRQALDGARATLGSAHRVTIAALDNLAQVLFEQGEFSAAEPLSREALSGFRSALGDDDSETLQAIANLACVLQAQGKFAEAEPLHREALTRIRAKLGDEHPTTLTTINNLAGEYYTERKFAEAEPLDREALAGRRAKLGDEHPDTLQSINNLALVLRARGDLAGAEPLFREALARRRATLGERHPDTLTADNNLADLLDARGKLSEAESLYREALSGCRATLGDGQPLTLSFMNNLGILLYRKGEMSEAESLCREALRGRRAKLGDAHPQTLLSIECLAALLHTQGRLDEAERLYREALERLRVSSGQGSADTLTVAEDLAAVLQDRGEHRAAATLLESSIELARKQPSSDSQDLVRDMQARLRDVYRAWHTADPSGGFDRKANEIDAGLRAH
jgi:non-specific serine/threonine protein kinase/serine/threonine-protein kinase